MIRVARLLGILALGATAQVDAQELDVRAELLRRGAPTDFADRVTALVRTARQEGLPSDEIANKALEGWAKRSRVSNDRVLAALDGLIGHFRNGRDAASDAGIAAPSTEVIGSAGMALARGLSREEIAELIRVAPTPEAAAAGMTVASSLGAQGLTRAAAVRAVNDALREGVAPERILELPSAIADVLGRGVPMSDVARSILEGRGIPGGPGIGPPDGAGRPPGVPPGRGPPDLSDLPGKAKGPGKQNSSS